VNISVAAAVTNAAGNVEDLTPVLHTEIWNSGWGQVLADTTLNNLKSPSGTLVSISVGGSATLHMALWLDANANSNYENQGGTVTFTFTATQDNA
jgi:hypothetical protein